MYQASVIVEKKQRDSSKSFGTVASTDLYRHFPWQALHVVSQLPAVIEILRNRREVEEEQQQVGTAATLLRIPLDNIRQAALELGRLSEVTVLGFREPTGIIRELVAALTAESVKFLLPNRT